MKRTHKIEVDVGLTLVIEAKTYKEYKKKLNKIFKSLKKYSPVEEGADFGPDTDYKDWKDWKEIL